MSKDNVLNFTSGVWRHYKGNNYLALGLAQHEDEDDYWVVYVRLYPQDERGGLPLRIRKLSEWQDIVDPATGRKVSVGSLDYEQKITVPRFIYVGVKEPKP